MCYNTKKRNEKQNLFKNIDTKKVLITKRFGRS